MLSPIVEAWTRLIRKKADWRQVVTSMPWLDVPYAVVGYGNGPGATRARTASYEGYVNGSLKVTSPSVQMTKDRIEQMAGRSLDWSQHTEKVEPISTVLHGDTAEFSGPIRWWSAQ